MHPPPIHRSRLLWLALPGLIFLLWAWLNDPAYFNFASITSGDHYLTIVDDGGSATIKTGVHSRGKWTAPGFFHDRWKYGHPAEFFPQALRYENNTNPYHTGITLSLSYWLLILLYLALLTAIRIGWSRRHARLAADATSTSPIPSS